MEEHSPSDESSSDDEPIVRVKKKRQASVFKCLMAELPASVEKKEAQRRAKTTDGCSWQSCGSNSTHCDYKCATHVACPRKIRLIEAVRGPKRRL